MKRIKYFVTSLLVALVVFASFGCYMVKGQKIDRLKGTYKLTGYTRTAAKTNAVTNYIEEYGYETYLVVTGSGTGYFAHKANNAEAYSREVGLSYTYSEEQTNLVEYVEFSASSSTPLAWTKFGVVSGSLNFSRPAIDILNGSDGLSISWKKVDKATDLSYVKSQLGAIKEYASSDFVARGIYEWETTTDIESGELVESEYQYYFIVIDTAQGVSTAKISYALKETPTVRVDETVSLSRGENGVSEFIIGGETWTLVSGWDSIYYNVKDGLRREICNRANYDIGEEQLNELIQWRMPTEE